MKDVTFKRDILPLKNMLFRVALRLAGTREDAEDIVQETLLRVWNRRDGWQQVDSLESWCVTICRNVAFDTLRHKNLHPVHEATTERPEQADNGPTPLEGAYNSQRVEILRKLIDTLPEKQRMCMHLRDVEAWSYKQIAEALGISIEQVKVSIHRGRQAVRNRFEEIDRYGL